MSVLTIQMQKTTRIENEAQNDELPELREISIFKIELWGEFLLLRSRGIYTILGGDLIGAKRRWI